MKYLTVLFAIFFFILPICYGQSQIGGVAAIRNYTLWVDSLADPDYIFKLKQKDSSINITTSIDNGKLTINDRNLKGNYRLATIGDNNAMIAYKITIEDNLVEFCIRNYYYKNNYLVFASLELQDRDNDNKVLFLSKEYYAEDRLIYKENPVNDVKRKIKWRTTMNLSQNGYACLSRFVYLNRKPAPSLAQRPATSFSQGNGFNSPRRLSGKYKYNSFLPGKIYYRNGDSAQYKLNLNYVDETMDFYDATGKILPLTNPETIKYITIGNNLFYYEKGYLEVILQTGSARLALMKTYKASPPMSFSNMSRMSRNGGFSPDFNSMPGQPGSGLPFNIPGGTGLGFTKADSAYYISDTRAPFMRATKRNVARIFSDRNKKIGQYFADKRVNMNKMQDLKELVVYISETR